MENQEVLEIKEIEAKIKTEKEVTYRDYLYLNICEEEYVLKVNQIGKKLKISNNTYVANQLINNIEINNKKYYLYTNNQGKLYISPSLNNYFQIRQRMYSMISSKNVYLFGIISNLSRRIKDYDNLYFNDENIHEKIWRPLPFWKFRHLGIIKISRERIEKSPNIHNTVSIGDSNGNYIDIRMKKHHKGMNYYNYKKWPSSVGGGVSFNHC